ncbi:DUF3710 domain-containing protein [Calidifontibacter sp. DB0510]|uniref:DUF3710 domain-containing protein n=1 Tax=Metallococcus carri TaxID=1656884 RepID=A0A967EHR7_9MICO|nr:DUF3710 domain-containing protein [Metallococcus carri]NHN56898.1 DUF3710 domain-containing protein [Metallococcus carri]NOP37643.1 DUF3710 domain-containing protein [Calidifontibacter sp. DB2511S]
MAIFRRRKQDEPADVEPHEVDTDEQATEESGDEVVAQSSTSTAEATDSSAAADVSDGSDSATTADASDAPSTDRTQLSDPAIDRSNGPYDRSEVDDLEGRLDFGAIAIVPVAGMELRLDVDETGQEITGLTAIHGESACQLQAFAAPKSRGLWREIRHEIADNLAGQRGDASEYDGVLGRELHVRMPAQGPDGRTTYSPARFVGVDGPRWFLRAVLSGAAAMTDEAAEEMVTFVRNIVVTRGKEARAPRELLPLRVPDAVQTEAPVESADDAEQSVPSPFERGPEITEVR